MMIEIINYTAEHQPYFERFNKAWIEKYFWLEPIDRFVLEHPDKAIIAGGGDILMATYNHVIAGTVALKKVNDEVYELTKMAVDEHYRRKGIAEALCYASFRKAKNMGAQKVILYSNTALQGAIMMYRKIGFTEVPMEQGVYQRSDIKMEIFLNNISEPVKSTLCRQ